MPLFWVLQFTALANVNLIFLFLCFYSIIGQTIIAVFYLIMELILCGKRKVALIEMAAACIFSSERY